MLKSFPLQKVQILKCILRHRRQNSESPKKTKKVGKSIQK